MPFYVRRVWWLGVASCLGSVSALVLAGTHILTMVAVVLLILLGTAWTAPRVKGRLTDRPPTDAAPILAHGWPLVLLGTTCLSFTMTLATTDLVHYSITHTPWHVTRLTHATLAVTLALESIWLLTWPPTHAAYRERRTSGVFMLVLCALYSLITLLPSLLAP